MIRVTVSCSSSNRKRKDCCTNAIELKYPPNSSSASGRFRVLKISGESLGDTGGCHGAGSSSCDPTGRGPNARGRRCAEASRRSEGVIRRRGCLNGKSDGNSKCSFRRTPTSAAQNVLGCGNAKAERDSPLPLKGGGSTVTTSTVWSPGKHSSETCSRRAGAAPLSPSSALSASQMASCTARTSFWMRRKAMMTLDGCRSRHNSISRYPRQ
mmetsp:Transcript_48194/g.148708  ORF Transcript_48194/g.148708 Transcript_48194/m.148708 type:complete len:211 (+) Transcript_48194:1134-1766(+)